jgi:hypothetical protein
MTSPASLPPVQDYVNKLMLLEAIRCYTEQDYHGLKWIETQMFTFVNRLRELNNLGR